MKEKEPETQQESASAEATATEAGERVELADTPGEHAAQSGLEWAQAQAAAQQEPDPVAATGAGKGHSVPDHKAERRPSRGPSWFLIFLLLLAVGGLGWFTWQQQLALQSLQTSLASGEAQAAALRARFETLTTSNSALQESLQQQGRELLAQVQEFQQQLLSLRLERNTNSPTPPEVLLAETRSLLRLGRERLLAGADVPMALSLYLAADQVLQKIDDPAIQQVRQTLQRETDSLRGVRIPDIGTAHAGLGELRDAVAGWPLVGGEEARELRFMPPGEAEPATAGSWLDGLQSRLSRYFIVTHQEGPEQPQLSEEGRVLARLQMELQLEQAMLALLRGEARLYRQSLDAVAAAIERWVLPSDVAALLERIDALRDTPLQATLPPLGATLNALQALGVR